MKTTKNLIGGWCLTLRNEINKTFPNKPGVYLFKDPEGNIIYVGKAKALKKRVLQHLGSRDSREINIRNNTADVDFIATDTEPEALALEIEMIKKYSPQFNVFFKDDKSYPYVRVTWEEEYPRLFIARKPKTKKDRSGYIGPYGSIPALKRTLNFLRKSFPVASCKSKITRGKRKRPCLEYGIKRCLAPCVKSVDTEEYQQLVGQFTFFLEGRDKKLIGELKDEMRNASNELEFERAALLRDRLEAIEKTIERRMISLEIEDHDFVGFSMERDLACLTLLSVREGRMIEQSNYVLKAPEGSSKEDVLESFIEQYYYRSSRIPSTVVIPFMIENKKSLQEWLTSLHASTVKIGVPEEDIEWKLFRSVSENAETNLKRRILRQQLEAKRTQVIMDDLKKYLPPDLGLARLHIVEGFDVSTLMGTDAVGSCIVFEDCKPKKSDYRRFKIKWVQGQDDIAMISEIVERRLRQIASNGKKLPDLILVDGGKGQLNGAIKAEQEVGVEIPTIALAKELEEIYVQRLKNPIRLPEDSPALLFLRRVRDEAHRFAVSYHRKLRKDKMVESILDGIPGVGPKTRSKLLKHFGSVERIYKLSVEEICSVSVSKKIAERILEYLHEYFSEKGK
ncbi:MAG: excinuclease ABC subunit UvrC [Promethearchaeota archaeon]